MPTPPGVKGSRVERLWTARTSSALCSVAGTLKARGIAWVPDFVANAGGLLYAVTVGRDERSREEAIAAVEALGDTATQILQRAENDGITTLDAAIRVADERLAAGRR